MVFILNWGFLIPYRTLAQVGFEPTMRCAEWSTGSSDHEAQSSLGDCSGRI